LLDRHRFAVVAERQGHRHDVVVILLVLDDGDLGRERALDIHDDLFGVEGVIVVGVVPVDCPRRHKAFLVGGGRIGQRLDRRLAHLWIVEVQFVPTSQSQSWAGIAARACLYEEAGFPLRRERRPEGLGDPLGCSATLRNTRAKSGLGCSAPTSRAISMKRFDSSGSSGGGLSLRGIEAAYTRPAYSSNNGNLSWRGSPFSKHVVDPQPNEVTARALYDVARQGPEALRRLPKVRFASDSLLEEAVLSELVSEAKLPASWENTGNFVRLGLRVRLFDRNLGTNSMAYDPIPYASEQGIYFGLAGN